MATVAPSRTAGAPSGQQTLHSPTRRHLVQANWLGSLSGWVWLAVVLVPLYWIVVTSFKTQSTYFSQNPLALPTSPTFENYRLVVESDFPRYFLNSTIVVLGTIIPAAAFAFMASYAIIRGAGSRWMAGVNGLFLAGLAIPLQATIIPVYLLIIEMKLYDSLLAIILPSVAFAIPLSVLVLTNFIRDVPRELFEAMRVDGAGEFMMLRRLALPLTRPALVTVVIYNGLTVWNGFLLPLVLTQSPEKRTLPLGLSSFQGQYSINVPAILASVVLSTLPIVVLYAVGRRQLLSGLSAGFSK